jgi:very-short-patch-repair endonuclease
MGRGDADASLRLLARHQWVRVHGTPRVSTLVGPATATLAVWNDWLRLASKPAAAVTTLVQPDGADLGWLTAAAGQALTRAAEATGEPIALLVDRELFARWRHAADDRLRAFVGEGIVEVGDDAVRAGEPLVADRSAPTGADASPRGPVAAGQRARSLAELAMFDALEATAATTGRFRLNEPLSFHFGGRALEADLLSRADDVVIEIDGYHHFTDVDGYRRDRRKDLLLQAHGYVVVRFLAEDILADASAAVRSVVDLLGMRRRLRRSE